MTFKPDDFEQSIARDEQWLRDTLAEPAGFDANVLKRRVQIELNQHWLAGELSDVEPTTLLAKTKQAVRETLRATRKEAPSGIRRLRIMRWTAGALSAAASVAFVVNAYRHAAPNYEPEISYLAAFEQFEAEDYSEPFTSLQNDLTSLATIKTQDESDIELGTIDELRNSINTLAKPASLSSDWS